MLAADVYRHLVDALEALGYARWSPTLSFREVPAEQADGKFQVVPAATEPQSAGIGAACIDTMRTWSATVLFRVLGSVTQIVEDRVLPAEEAITDALLGLEEVESVASSYTSADDGGGFISLSLAIVTRYDRPL